MRVWGSCEEKPGHARSAQEIRSETVFSGHIYVPVNRLSALWGDFSELGRGGLAGCEESISAV